MSSKALVIGVVALVILVGGYMLYTKNTEPNETAENTIGGESESTNESEGQPTGKKIAFSEFIKQGGSYKCTVNQYMEDMETKGTVYIDGDMVRGEYTVEAQGMTIDSTMIVRDGYTYSWSSMMPNVGYKIKAQSSGQADTSAGTSGSYAWNADQIGDYNCEAWRADAAMFTLPSNVTFTAVGS